MHHHSSDQNLEHESKQHAENQHDKKHQLHSDEVLKNFYKTEKSEKFINVSKYKPLKVLIPRIDFVQDTFKEFEKVKEEFEWHKQRIEAEIEKLRADAKIREAWAKKGDLKYLILKDEEQNEEHHGH